MANGGATESTSKPDRTWWIIGLSLVLAWCVYLVFFGPEMPSNGPRLEKPASEKPADFHWKVVDLTDAPVDLAAYKGKTVFLNIWATWCPPCVAELPAIARLAEESRLKDVAFVCVSTDNSSVPVRKFLNDKKWKLTVLRAEEPPPDVFLSQGIPATYLIAPDGRVAVAEVGSVDWDVPAVVDVLEGLSKGTPAPRP